jgi:cysteine desulfurase/selenocysteine lyase
MNVRQDFQILQKKIHGKPVIYFDSACVALKPRQVTDAMMEYYTSFTACHGRSNHAFAAETTKRFSQAHRTLEKFVGAKEREIVFTKNTTEAINTVASGLDWPKGSNVVTTNAEHNSNLVPWMRLAQERGVEHRIVPVAGDGTLDLHALASAVDRRTRLVSLFHTSNVTAATIDARAAAKIAHDSGALLMLDSAQSVPHRKVDVKRDDIDFMAFSGHKMLGPSGTGALYAKKHLLEQLKPLMLGGETVKSVTKGSYELEDVPSRFEAGLQDYGGAIGMAAAADYLSRLGMDNVQKHDAELGKRLAEGILSIERVRLLGPLTGRAALAAFSVKGIAPHDVAAMLDEGENIFVRSGVHCTHLYHTAVGEPLGTVRASLYVYNTAEEIDRFVSALTAIVKHFS